jgi:enoyl-CoA hydratase
MSEPEPVRYERRGAAAVITIDRQHRRNAVDGHTAAALHDGYLRFEADDEARVLVVTGAGGVSFCAGADLKATETMAGRLLNEEGPMGLRSRCGATCASPPRARRSATQSGAGACR